MGLLWVIVGIILLSITKLVSSLNLKRIKAKIAVDSQTVFLLKETFRQVDQEEKDMMAEMNRLEHEELSLKQIVDKLEQKLSEPSPSPVPAASVQESALQKEESPNTQPIPGSEKDLD